MRFFSKFSALLLVLMLPALVGAQDPQPNPTPSPRPAPAEDHPAPPTPPVVNPGDDPAPPPPAEGERRRRGRGGAGLIDRFDRNGDGVLDKTELEGIPEGMRRRLGGADTNGDGTITGEELDRILGGGAGRPAPEDGGDNPRPERRRGGGLIERFDRNGDGVLDKEELEGMPEGMRRRLGPADTNGDGVITPEEMEGFGRGRRPGPEGGPPPGEGPPGGDGNGPPQRRGGGLERLDRNGDGVIDKEELEGMPEALRRRLGGLDRNGDGIIDREELGAGRRGRGGQDGDQPRRRRGHSVIRGRARIIGRARFLVGGGRLRVSADSRYHRLFDDSVRRCSCGLGSRMYLPLSR